MAWGLSLTGLGQWQLCSLALIWARSGGAGHLREGVEGALGEQDQPDLESGLALAYDGCSEQVSGRESGRLTQSSDPGLDWLWVWLLRAVGTRRTAPHTMHSALNRSVECTEKMKALSIECSAVCVH